MRGDSITARSLGTNSLSANEDIMKLSTLLSTVALLVVSTAALAFPQDPNAIPEPETYALLGLAAAAFVAARWKK
jgi:hypothetical protein